MQAAAMVFELVSNVYERNSVEIIQKSTKLYKALQIDLQVDNAFQKEVLFNISVQYERNGVIKGGKGAGGAQGKAGDKGKAGGGKAGAAGQKQQAAAAAAGGAGGQSNALGVPEPFHIKQEQLKIKKGNQNGTVQILFLPFELGIHKAHIIFCDEAVGEIQYTIIGKAELPEILDTFSGECNSEVPFQFTKTLNFRNDKLEQARNQILEKDKKERKKESSLEVADPRANNAARKENIAQGGNDPKSFEIEISNPFFTGPNSIVLQDLS